MNIVEAVKEYVNGKVVKRSSWEDKGFVIKDGNLQWYSEFGLPDNYVLLSEELLMADDYEVVDVNELKKDREFVQLMPSVDGALCLVWDDTDADNVDKKLRIVHFRTQEKFVVLDGVSEEGIAINKEYRYAQPVKFEERSFEEVAMDIA